MVIGFILNWIIFILYNSGVGYCLYRYLRIGDFYHAGRVQYWQESPAPWHFLSAVLLTIEVSAAFYVFLLHHEAVLRCFLGVICLK